MQNIIKEKTFSGSIQDYIKVCQKWLAIYVIGKKDFNPNERLIRGYVSEGILPKPERKGKEAIYNYKHLIYFLACRDLFSENWPLAKINEYFRSISFDDLETNLLNKFEIDTNNDSMAVIKKLKQEVPRKIKPKNNKLASPNYVSKMMTQSYQSSAQAIKNFGSDFSKVSKDEFTTFTLSSWLSLAIKTQKLNEIDSDLAFRIGNAVKAALLDNNIEENIDLYQDKKEKTELQFQLKRLDREVISLKNIKSDLEKELNSISNEYHANQQELKMFQKLENENQKLNEIKMKEISKLYKEKIDNLEDDKKRLNEDMKLMNKKLAQLEKQLSFKM